MTQKQLKSLATKIAVNEKIIQTSKDPSAVTKAQDAIYFLSSQLDIEDMLALDDIIQEILG